MERFDESPLETHRRVSGFPAEQKLIGIDDKDFNGPTTFSQWQEAQRKREGDITVQLERKAQKMEPCFNDGGYVLLCRSCDERKYPFASSNIIGRVIETKDDMFGQRKYALATEGGLLSEWVKGDQLRVQRATPTQEQMALLEHFAYQRAPEISMQQAFNDAEKRGGVSQHPGIFCRCKQPGVCKTNRCKCNKWGQQCGPACHAGKNCSNMEHSEVAALVPGDIGVQELKMRMQREEIDVTPDGNCGVISVLVSVGAISPSEASSLKWSCDSEIGKLQKEFREKKPFISCLQVAQEGLGSTQFRTLATSQRRIKPRTACT